jgi:hypothetical protein
MCIQRKVEPMYTAFVAPISTVWRFLRFSRLLSLLRQQHSQTFADLRCSWSSAGFSCEACSKCRLKLDGTGRRNGRFLAFQDRRGYFNRSSLRVRVGTCEDLNARYSKHPHVAVGRANGDMKDSTFRQNSLYHLPGCRVLLKLQRLWRKKFQWPNGGFRRTDFAFRRH